MPDLNEQQFAKYTARMVPHRVLGYEIKPVPTSMERHGPGSYQPTLPGMEKMLPGEMTHTDVFFHHPNAMDPETADVPGSNWWFKNRNYHSRTVHSPVSSLHPTQDWVDDNHLHEPIHHRTLEEQGTTPKVEKVRGKNVIHDGHHRAAREILSGKKRIDIERWD